MAGRGAPVRFLRFQGCSLEPDQSPAELFVGATIGSPANGAQERMERERDGAIGWSTAFVIPSTQFDVHVLIKRARESVTGRRQYPPPASGLGGEYDGTTVRRVTQAEEGKRLQTPIEESDPRWGPAGGWVVRVAGRVGSGRHAITPT